MHRTAAGALVQIVDILGDDADLSMVLLGGDRAMPVVGFDVGHQIMAP